MEYFLNELKLYDKCYKLDRFDFKNIKTIYLRF